MDTLYASEWDRCWSAAENQPWYPDEQVVRFLARYIVRRMGFASSEVKFVEGDKPARGLDLGCGKGRHVVLMSELGIEAWGSDISQLGLDFTRDWLKSKNLEGTLDLASVDKQPYEDEFFDFVICHGVLDHCLAGPRMGSINEVNRILKPGGYYFFSVISEEDSAFGSGKKIEEDTWLVEDGYEKDIPQAFFTMDRIRREFSTFDIVSIVKCDGLSVEGRSLIGTDKHYGKDSRYYVTVRKK